MSKLILEKISENEYAKRVRENNINSTTIYCVDNSTLYIGSKLYSGNVKIIEQDPTYPEMNTLYIDKNTLSIKIYNGVSYDTISKGYTFSIDTNVSDDLVPTAKAVVTFIQNKIQEITESGAGITSISYAENGELSVIKDGNTEIIPLNGMAYSPTYDEVTRKLTIPLVGNKALEINFAKDTCVTAGKYNGDTKEIWLTLAEDKTYADESKLIKIPVQDLIDIFTGKETPTTTTTVSSSNEISVDVRVSSEKDNALSVKSDGLYVSIPSDTNKLDKVSSSHLDEIITANADGTVKVSGIKIGSGSLAVTPNINTVATEAAVKTYTDNVAIDALNNAKTYSDNGDTTTLNDAKAYADDLIEWVNF